MSTVKMLTILVLGLMVCVVSVSNAATMGTAITYQGRLIDNNTAADGQYDFEFKLFDDPCTGTQQGSTIEVNDLDVIDGYFTAELDFGSSVFNGDSRWLEISVRLGASIDGNDFATLIPRQQITPTPYAAYAKNTEKYAQVVTVAASGGDYTSVQTAIDSISDANDNKPYLVWVAPGVYNESVTMKSYVHLQGAGQEATVITSSIDSGFPPTDGTLTLSHHTSLRDLTVVNNGTGSYPTALVATAGTTEVLVADITVKAHGQSSGNFAVFIGGSGTSVTLQDVTALGENGSSFNYGLRNDPCAVVTLRGGVFKARGGNSAYAILNNNSEMVAESVTALAENGSSYNQGLLNNNGADVKLIGGSFCGRGGTYAIGVSNGNINTTLEVYNINALAENGGYSYGLSNNDAANAKLNGGTFTARGGTRAYGIRNASNNPTLEANNIKALAENGSSNNYGLFNDGGIADVTQSVLESPQYSAYNYSGTLVISNSRLVGGPCSGSITCVAISRGTTFNTNGCP